MQDIESLAKETCIKFLSLPDLKEICRSRGFDLPSGNKESVSAFVAARLPETSGVARALGSLDERGRLLLHAITMQDNCATVEDLRRIIQPGAGMTRWLDDRAVFETVKSALLSKGVVLVRVNPQAWHGESRFSRAQFVFPAQFRKWMPALPIQTISLAGASERCSPSDFLRASLQLAARRLAQLEETPGAGLLDAVADLWSVHDKLQFGKRGADRWLETVRATWVERWTKRSGLQSQFRWAAYALRNLPDGCGVTLQSLQHFLEKVSATCSTDQLTGFLREGLETGLLIKHCQKDDVWGMNLEPAAAGAFSEKGIACHERGISVDLSEARMDCLFSLAPVSFIVGTATSRDATALVLSPDTVSIGKNLSQLTGNAALKAARRLSPIFDESCRLVEERHGQLIVHKGLSVFRITDQALLSLVNKHFGQQARMLGPQYLAVPADRSEAVTDFIVKHGFKPRMVS